MSEFRVLLVEDDEALRDALCETLELEDIAVTPAAGAREALELIGRKRPSLVISDIQMPECDGIELLRRIRVRHPALPVILMTAFGTVPQAVAAIREGAIDYLVKPVEADELIDRVGRFRDRCDDEELIAEDPRSREVAGMARRVAEAEVNVLLSGPSGSGKEAYARYIHRRSNRRAGPFVAVNCAAIPEHMIEAELFGHEKGAFTGADRARAGKFEAADGGTLLLDEISELDIGLQAKLLRVLQERVVERLGGNRSIPLDLRVIACTNRNLADEVRAGRFREDLFYRLNVFPIVLPPLAERPGDIGPLAERALARHHRAKGVPPRLSSGALERLIAHDWPGNVRELDNVIQRALVLCGRRAEIRPDDLFFEHPLGGVQAQGPGEGGDDSLQRSMADREAQVILETLRREGGHRGRTAERLGISPRTLRYKLSRLRKSGLCIPGEDGPNLATGEARV
jgi:two-component system response regulator FlrC